MSPIQQSLELVANQVEQNNLLIKGLLGHREVQMAYFSTDIVKSLMIIAVIFAAIMVAAFTIPESVGYFAVGGFVAAIVPLVMLGKAVRCHFN